MERQLHGEPRAVARAALDGQAASAGLDAILQAYAIATHKTKVMASELRSCRRCSVLEVIDTPIASAEQRMPSLVPRFGGRWRYLLAVNGAYIEGARAGLIGAGHRADDPRSGLPPATETPPSSLGSARATTSGRQ